MAVFAVFKLPLFEGAWTTINALENEAIKRLRFKKEYFWGGTSEKYSLMIVPPLAIIWFTKYNFELER